MIPESLNQAISQAETSIKSSSRGHMFLAQRRTIWREMGPPMESVGAFGVGVYRRAALGVLCLRFVIPVWRTAGLADTEIQSAIEMITSYFRKPSRVDEADRLANKLATRGDNVAAKGEMYFRASYVARAASCAIFVATSDSDCRATDAVGEEYEADDPYDWDCELWACMAWADDVWITPPAFVDERRQFWRWYLDEAVPQAYDNYLAILGI